jgi:hypothetical protein
LRHYPTALVLAGTGAGLICRAFMTAPAPRRPPPPEGLRLTLRLLRAWWRDRGQFSSPRLPRHCPICDYRGVFISVGHPPRWDARCPGCGSRERHRLTELWITRGRGRSLRRQAHPAFRTREGLAAAHGRPAPL